MNSPFPSPSFSTAETGRQAWRQQGVQAYQAGRLDEAEACFRRERAGGGADNQLFQLLGAICVMSGRGKEAIEHFRRAVALEPGDGISYYNLGLTLRTENQPAQAEAVLSVMLRLESLGDAHYQLGQIQQDRGAFVAASHHLACARTHGVNVRECEELVLFNQVFHTGERIDLAPSRQADPPLVSLVIPCVNHGRFLVEAVESCLAQTYPAVEVIVVEGGSDDGETRALVERLFHPRLRCVFRSPRRRAGDNRNFGLGLARGVFAGCLDADDRLAPDYVEKAVFALTRLDYDVVGSGVRLFGALEGERRFLRRPRLEDFLTTNQLAMGALFRRELWAASGGFYDSPGDEAIHEDWNFWVRLVARGARVLNLTWERLILCRQHAQERQSARSNLLPLDQQRERIRRWNADLLSGEGMVSRR